MEFEMDDEMKQELKKITNLRSDDNIWKLFIRKYRNSYPKTNLIKLRFKRDHKKQKRIQCAISYNNFISNFEVKDINRLNKYVWT